VQRAVALSQFPSTGYTGQQVSLKTLVYSGGAAAIGLPVTFSVDGSVVGKATSTAAGAAFLYAIPTSMATGPHSVTVAFAGDNAYAALSRTTSALTVLAGKASVSLSLYAVNGAPGQTVTLKSLVMSGGSALIGKTVKFSVDGAEVGSGVSAAGGASFSYKIPVSMADGIHNVTASFAGDSAYNPASRTTPALTIATPQASVGFSLFTSTGRAGTVVTLRSLMLSGGAPLAGKTVEFQVDGAPAGSGVSDANGVATAYTIPASLAPGTHNVTVSFAGDRFYKAAMRTSPALVVARILTALSLDSVSGSAGDAVNLRCVLTANGQGVSSRTVSFWVDGVAVGSTATDASGVGTKLYRIPAGTSAGAHTVKVEFDGSRDTTYESSSLSGMYLTVR
jgi:hypothetical protein